MQREKIRQEIWEDFKTLGAKYKAKNCPPPLFYWCMLEFCSFGAYGSAPTIEQAEELIQKAIAYGKEQTQNTEVD